MNTKFVSIFLLSQIDLKIQMYLKLIQKFKSIISKFKFILKFLKIQICHLKIQMYYLKILTWLNFQRIITNF